jgi:hypothetical protein
MEEHVFRVMMFLTAGVACPCTLTRLAIWITESFSASGKWPCVRGTRALRPHRAKDLGFRGDLQCLRGF